MKKLLILVVTGGPCGGKSTALARLSEKMAERGIPVFIVPELATDLFSNGIDGKLFSGNENLRKILQTNILHEQLQRQYIRKELAEIQMEHTGAEQGILICDRGTLDSEAYCGREMFEQIVSEEKMSIASLREFYDVVYHFVTAAEGAQKYYTLANNKARRETPKEARALDQLLRDAWTGHEHLEIIHNRESGRVLTFRQKMDKFITSVTNQLAMPPIEAEKKFQLLDKINVKKLPVSRIIQQEIFQIYLHSDKPNLQRRIRKITPIGQGLAETFYVYAEKEKIPGTAHRPEMQDRISISEYERLLHQKNPNLAPILKIRHNFVYDFKYWHLDIFIEPEPNLCFIEHEHAINSREKITPPSFLGRYVDITSSFSNYDLASGKRPVKK